MTIQEWFDKYAEHHQHPTNKAIHWICVPAIFFSLIGLLSLLKFNVGSEILPPTLHEQLHLGTLVIVFGLIFFSRLSRSITVGMAIVSFLILKGIAWMNQHDVDVLKYCVAIFVIAWVGQFIGHKIEGAKPSFLNDLKFLLIGPAWLLSFIYKRLGIRY